MTGPKRGFKAAVIEKVPLRACPLSGCPFLALLARTPLAGRFDGMEAFVHKITVELEPLGRLGSLIGGLDLLENIEIRIIY